MSSVGRDTLREILSQPEIWETTLKQLVSGEAGDLPELSSYDYVLFTGCGSTYFLSQWAADVRDVGRRLLRALLGMPEAGFEAMPQPAIPILLGLGLDEFSMVPAAIPGPSG